MDKKSIVLIIVSSIILMIAIVFAIWSFQVDLTVAENNHLANTENNRDIVQNSNMDINSNQANTVLEEETETKDFSATYTDFTVEDSTGNSIKLSDYKDSPIMVLFWNSENEDSVEMLNRINEQYDNYKEYIKFIAIQTGEQTTAELQDIKFPIYYDKNEEIVKIYHIEELPTMLYINKENEIFNSKIGLTSVDALTANLDILAENF